MSMDQGDAEMASRNKQLILDHFAALIDGKDLGAVGRNLAPDFHDHDGPGGRTDRDSEAPMIAALHRRMPDAKVEVRDAMAEGDRVIVRNVWSGTDAVTGERLECHGFVQWRIRDGTAINRRSDRAQAGEDGAKQAFDRGHRLSVIVNALQLAAAAGVFVHLTL